MYTHTLLARSTKGILSRFAALSFVISMHPARMMFERKTTLQLLRRRWAAEPALGAVHTSRRSCRCRSFPPGGHAGARISYNWNFPPCMVAACWRCKCAHGHCLRKSALTPLSSQRLAEREAEAESDRQQRLLKVRQTHTQGNLSQFSIVFDSCILRAYLS